VIKSEASVIRLQLTMKEISLQQWHTATDRRLYKLCKNGHSILASHIQLHRPAAIYDPI